MNIEPADNRIETCIAVRIKVFVEEQKVPLEMERDEYDDPGKSREFLLMEGSDPIGTFRIIRESESVAHLQRICILKEYRKKGYGAEILNFCDRFCRVNGYDCITLDAQCHAIGFYEKSGYAVCSAEFMDAGIPHRKMAKRL